MPRLDIFPIQVLGGIEQSKPIPEAGDMETLENFLIFRGRLGVRAPVAVSSTLQDDQGTPADVDAIYDLVAHDNKLYALSYSSSQTDVYLHEMDADGENPSNLGVVWSSVSSESDVVPVMASISGGDATSPESRLYISDYDQNEVTKFYDGTTINTLQADLDNDSTDEDITFSIVYPYKFHLWGTGFFEPGANPRPEMLRFSTPGLIPANDIAGGNNPKEWHHADHRSVGVRGRKITAITEASANMVVCQNSATHAVFGYNADSWQTRIVSAHVGAVGPYAITTDGIRAYMWTSDGPFMTDARQMVDIGGPIKEEVLSVDGGQETQAVFSPDDGIVYFVVKPSEGSATDLYLAFDTVRQRWMSGSWLDGAGTATKINVGAAAFLKAQNLPGPSAAPSSLSVSLNSDGKPSLSWTSGDTALGVTTTIHRDTSPSITPGAGNEIGEVFSGVSTFDDSSAAAKTTYYYVVRHERNGQNSAASNEVSQKTALAKPTGVSAVSIQSPDGVRINYTQNSNNSDIRIQRKLSSSGSFADLTTLSSIASGAQSHDDTTGTSGEDYDYRLRAEETGETASPWSDTVSATAGQPADPQISSTGHTTTENGGVVTVTVNWNGNGDFEVGVDTVKVYSILDGGTPNLETTWVATNTTGSGSYDYEWGQCPNPSASTLQFKLEVYKGGSTLNDTNYEEASGFDPCSELGPPPSNPEDLTPDGDISNSGYSTAPLHSKLVSDSSDGEIQGTTVNGISSAQDSFEVSLSDPSDTPVVDKDHTIKVTSKKGGTSTQGFIQFTATVKQGSTTIASKSFSNFSTSYNTASLNLTESEASNITDYTDLRIEIDSDTVGEESGESVIAFITKLALEIPVPI